MQSLCPSGRRLLRPLARKDFRRISRHIDAIVRLAPFEFEIAAAEVIDNLPLGTAGKHSGHANRARPCPARQRLSAPSFPRALADFTRRKNLDEFDVYAGWKRRRLLDLRP